ncbi:MAG TPA: ferric reductase-like transmembrane domain-containing protein [Solirubrobacteraceae bacterium]|nr:ferric reductase-like transmembrane domain-containing protein [Solirubrobacteraceae bacterium]
MTIAATSGSALWFATRATGVTALILLTLTVVLGVSNVARVHRLPIPRFVFDSVHRNAALLSVSFVALHVASAIADGYVPIRVADAFVPFGAAYRPLWLGLGAVSLDLLLAVIVTSLLRRRLGYRLWRLTHWLAYASWPVALLHSLGAGSDAGTRWMTAVAIGCTAAMIAAVAARLAGSGHGRSGPLVPAPRGAR